MYKSFVFLFLSGASSLSFGQRYKTVDIIKKANSLIISAVGQNVFNNNYQLDSTKRIDSWQKIYDKEKGINQISLTSKKNGHFKFIAVDYIFYVKKYEQPSVRTRVILDNNLHPKYTVDTSFIPKFILQKTEDNFLSKEQALKIAKSQFKKQGLKIESRIYYNPDEKDYVWEMTNIIEESPGGGRIVELIKVDPVSGKTVSYFQGLEGQLH